jgi:heme o synthase
MAQVLPIVWMRSNGMEAEPEVDFFPHSQMMRAKTSDYLQLTKPKLTTLVLFSTFVGFCIGSPGPVRLGLLLHTLLGTALMAGGAAASNMYAEREVDARMRRTALRPLPAGRLRSKPALFISLAMSLAGFVYLFLFVNYWASLLSAIIFVDYLFLYTPLKTKTWLSTLAGAAAGALPIVMGWASAGGAFAWLPWVLFSIVFLWQIPHFHSISWLHREDYRQAGLPVLSAIDEDGRRTGRQVVLSISLLIVCTLLLVEARISGRIYPAGAIALGFLFLSYGIYFARQRDRRSAHRLFVVSALYLPALFILLLIDHFWAR